MPSQALANWRGSRSDGLDALERVHGSMTQNLQGRPRDTAELNHALISRLSSDLQAFVRDLLDEAVTALLAPVQITTPTLARTYRISMERGRKMDQGNPNPGNIGNDFAALGCTFWADLNAAYAQRAPQWNTWLTWLNLARNGIAHNDLTKIDDARAEHPLTLATFRRLRGVLEQFTDASDRVVGAYLKSITGVDPW